ncbi:hypothetical protein [Prauserella shujinwangii]|uniref:hypothetical protein n=1 Tax=Prauserella shujinwangii TaxID=1453103 RepID=UPI0015E5C630|nr:hypothetical protein [Prauserella shujinwangii]
MLLTATVLAVVLVLWLGARSPRRLGGVVLLAVPFSTLGFAATSAPDLLERMLLPLGF